LRLKELYDGQGKVKAGETPTDEALLGTICWT